MQMLHIPVHLNTCPHQSCVDYVLSSFAKLQAIEYFLPIEATLLALCFSPNSDSICTESNLHIFYMGSVDFYRKKHDEQDLNSFSTSGPRNTKIARDVTVSSVRTLQYLACTKDVACISYHIKCCQVFCAIAV